MTRKEIAGLIIAGLMLTPLAVAAEESDDLISAMTAGRAHESIRYRYEFVDQDSPSLINQQANASTARLRLNYRTGQWSGWSLFGEFDYVGYVIATDFDSGAGTSPNKQGVYPVVADPKGADLNQLYLDYSTSDDWKFRLGRQRINLDNQRFVGGVGWRQNEQTYDAITLTTKAIPKTAFSYTFMNRVRRIFGERVDAGTDRVDGHLLNAKVTINDTWSVVPYLYYLDYKVPARSANSTSTFGARLAGSVPVGDGKLAIVAEYARQSDIADNPNNYDADYIHADVAWVMNNGLSLGLGIESLGSDNGSSFRTPLATLHKFQGWADKFLATPPDGIDDVYVTVKFTAAKWNFTGVYHDFSAESGGGDFGTEFDIAAARKISDHYAILLKGAFFSSDSVSIDDTTKLWLMFTASY